MPHRVKLLRIRVLGWVMILRRFGCSCIGKLIGENRRYQFSEEMWKAWKYDMFHIIDIQVDLHII